MKNKQPKNGRKKITVSATDLFANEAVGGLTYEEWTAADDLTRLKKRLGYIADRAQALSEMPYTTDSDFPANMLSHAKNLCLTARDSLKEIEDNNFINAAWFTLEVGKKMSELNRILLLWGQLQVVIKQRDANKKGGEKPKRRQWADQCAMQLALSYSKFPDAWRSISKHENSRTDVSGSNISVYRSNNGSVLVAIDNEVDTEIGQLTKGTFRKTYFSPAKKRDTN